jgi:hypothetical protein
MLERIHGAHIMQKSLKKQWLAIIVPSRALRTEFAPIVVSMQDVR